MAEYEMIPVGRIRANPYQPRETFEKEAIQELADSMKSLDLLQPLVVRPDGDGYQIACGERRWRAAQMAGWNEVPAIVQEMDDRTLQLYSLVENLHRLDLESREKEKAVYHLWSEYYEKQGRPMADLAKELGVSDSWVGDLISAYKERKGLKAEGEKGVTTYDLQVTRGIQEPVRKQLLEKKAKGEIAQQELEELAPIVKEAPAEKQRAIVEETTREIGEARRIVREEAEAFATGEMEARDIGVKLDADQKRLNRFLELSNKVRYWTVASVEMIQNDRLRNKAVEYIEDVRDHLDSLLAQLRKRSWYARGRP